MPNNLAHQTLELLCHPDHAARLGRAGREHVINHWSVERMVNGYQDLIADIYETKAMGRRQRTSGKEKWSLGVGSNRRAS